MVANLVVIFDIIFFPNLQGLEDAELLTQTASYRLDIPG